jgi:hemerythrin-like domain-containing protein
MCDHCGCRAFPAIADLSAEHETILELAWELAEATRTGRPARTGVADDLRALLDRHIDKEERALYPLLVDVGDLDRETKDALEDEHVEVRAALADGAFDRRDYYALGAHIEQEEMELFPAAMFGFDDDAWDALYARGGAIAASKTAATSGA